MELNPLKWFAKKDKEERGQSRGPQHEYRSQRAYPSSFQYEDIQEYEDNQEVERLARGFASSNLSEDAQRQNQESLKELASRYKMTEGEFMIYVRNASIVHESQRKHGEFGEKLINSLGALSEMNVYNAIKGNLPEWLEKHFPVLSRVVAKSASARTLVTAGVVFGGGIASAAIGIPVLGLAVATATSAVAGYDFARRLSRTIAKEKFEDYRRFLDGINVDEWNNALIKTNPSTENEKGEIEPLCSIVKRMAEQLIQGGHRFGEALGLTADGEIDLNSQEAKLLLAYEKVVVQEADEEKLQKEIHTTTDPDRALLRIARTDDAVEADFQRLLISKRTEGMQRVMNALRADQKKEKVHGALGAVAGGVLGNVARAFGAVAFRGMTLDEYARSMFSASWPKGALTPEPTAPPSAEPTAPPSAEPTAPPSAEPRHAAPVVEKKYIKPSVTGEEISTVPEQWRKLEALGTHLSEEVKKNLVSAQGVHERGTLLNILGNLEKKGLITIQGDKVGLKMTDAELEAMYQKSLAHTHATADAYGKKIKLGHWQEWFGDEESSPRGARSGVHAERTSARTVPTEPRMPRGARVVPESGAYTKGVRADEQVLSDTRPGKVKPGVIRRPEEIALQEDIDKGLSQREQEVIAEQNARRARSVQPVVRETPPAPKPPEVVPPRSTESLRFTIEARIGEAMLNQRLKFYNNLDKYLTENYAPLAKTPSEPHGLLLRETGKNLVVNEALHAELIKQGRTEEAASVAREMAQSVTSIVEKYGREIINPAFLSDAVRAQIDFDKLPTLRDVLKLPSSTPLEILQDMGKAVGKVFEGGATESAAVQPGETSAAPKEAQQPVAKPAVPVGEVQVKGGVPADAEETKDEKGTAVAVQKEAAKLSPEEVAQQAYRHMQDSLYKNHGINPRLVDYTESLRVSYFLEKIQEIASGKTSPNAVFGSGADQYSMKDWETLSKYITDHEPTASEKRMVLKNYLLSKEK